MHWPRVTTIRGKLVFWYLGVLATLLVGLGVFQSVTLTTYVRTSATSSLRRSANQELAVLNPCFVRSRAGLRHNARTLAGLLGDPDTAVTIVTSAGTVLAGRGLGPTGAQHPPHLSSATIQRLIGQSQTPRGSSADIEVSPCPRPHLHSGPQARHDAGPVVGLARSLISGGNKLLVAVPLGPSGSPVGYAILGRSLSTANATIARMLLVFVLGAGLALLVAACVALPLINQALRPLRRVADAAEAIAAGNVTQRAHLAHSVDEVGRLGEAFDAMVDRMQAALAAREASEDRMRHFLADASHELRTPVTVLRGASQVLLRQAERRQPEIVAGLRDMHAEAVRLSRLVDDLLTLSRIDAGQSLAPRVVELSSFVPVFLDRYASVWADRRIWFDAEALSGATAQVDPEALRRVLTNLIDNAARYSRSGGAITVTGHVEESDVAVAVADEGPGLSAEDAQRVFDRFYRTSRSRSRHSGGTGLGLAIVQGLVEQSGGTIRIDTSPERGTAITVTLPRAAGVGGQSPIVRVPVSSASV